MKAGTKVSYITIFGEYTGTLQELKTEPQFVDLVNGKRIVEFYITTAKVKLSNDKTVTLSGTQFSFPHYNLKRVQ